MSLTVKKLEDLLSVAVKRKVLEDITLRPNKMIDAKLKGDPDYLNVLTTKDNEYIRHTAYHTQKKKKRSLWTRSLFS